ncbi:MAG: hypothetical protein ABI353_23770 [Isosphaeraceae bacterium]
MTDLQGLVKQLAELPRDQYSNLIQQVDAERRHAVEQQERAHPPSQTMSRDEFARWIGRRHFAIDKGIRRILYLPTGAPTGEVRLLEVNVLASIPETAPVEAVDFMPEIEGINYTLFVADVSPHQLDAVMKNQLALPPGWDMRDHQEIFTTAP